MEKKIFIQGMMISCKPPAEKFDQCIDYSLEAWEALSRRGYGQAQKGKPKEISDSYSKLGAQKEGFDKFWNAYDLKKGREGAVTRWLQLDPSEELTGQIIAGAKREAKARRESDATPKHAQGWLTERRWEDSQGEEKVKTETNSDVKQNNLRNELKSAREMLKYAQASNDEVSVKYWKGEIAKLEHKSKGE